MKAALDPASNAPSGATAAPTGTEEPPSLNEVAKLFPQLEILEVLGHGGMGVVYKARQKQLDRIVALKIMLPQFSRDPSFVERFNREARALAKLNHPNIVAVYDFGQAGGQCYFIMEFVDGANLRSVIQSGKLTAVEALVIVPKLCDALQFAHDEGVVHRDIKPANILVDRKGRVKIADFGLAKLAGTTDFSLTRSQQGMGTPQYMAPEQLENAKSVDHRADIYSLGVVFYEMLTGELPLGRFPLPSSRMRGMQIDVRLDEIVLKALEREPARRYQQASEVRTQVENVTSTAVVKAPPAATPVPQIPVSGKSGEPDFQSSAKAGPQLCNLAVISAGWAIVGLVCGGVIAFWFYAYRGIPAVIMLTMLLTLISIICAPITGAVAISRIRRSNGQLTGLPFAAFGLLCYPMLLLAAAAFGLTHLVQIAFWTQTHTSYSSDGSGQLLNPIAPNPANRPDVMFLILDTLVALVVCFFASFLAWRKIARVPDAPAKETKPTVVNTEPCLSRLALGGAILGLLGLLAATGFVLLHFNYFYESEGRSLRPGDWMRIATALCVLAAGAAFGATILGGLAVVQIKRSGGKLYGLPLAFADAVFFPLLVFAGFIAFLAAQIWAGLAPHPNAASLVASTSFGTLVALGVSFFIARALWRKINPAVVGRGDLLIERESASDTKAGQLIQNAADGLIIVAATALFTAVCIGVGLGVLYLRNGPSILSISKPNMIGPNPLIGMAVILFIYALFLGLAGIQMRRMKWRFYVLLNTMIAGLFVPVMLIFNVVMERVPEWPALIPVWLGIPVAAWVLAVLFRVDVRAAFAKAGQTKPTTEP